MATKIKATPILTGEAAREFEKVIKANENKKVPRADYDRAVRNYNSLKQ